MIIEIDLVKLASRGLNINEYLTIYKIYHQNKDINIPFYSSKDYIEQLVEKGFLKYSEDKQMVYLTNKSLKLVGETPVDFDELFNLYPYKTESGRRLRSKEKEVLGNITRDYKVLSQKYLSKVKNKEIHDTIVKATKVMINDYKRRGASDYLPKLETYINQHGWEKYVDQIEKGHEYSEGGNVEKL